MWGWGGQRFFWRGRNGSGGGLCAGVHSPPRKGSLRGCKLPCVQSQGMWGTPKSVEYLQRHYQGWTRAAPYRLTESVVSGGCSDIAPPPLACALRVRAWRLQGARAPASVFCICVTRAGAGRRWRTPARLGSARGFDRREIIAGFSVAENCGRPQRRTAAAGAGFILRVAFERPTAVTRPEAPRMLRHPV